MTDIWTPSNVLTRGTTKEVRPFEKLALEAAKLGFKCEINHDAAERVVHLRFAPTTDKARAACRSALDNPEGDGLLVGMQYRTGDNPLLAIVACWEHGMQTIKEAL